MAGGNLAITAADYSLLTDLYQLTMSACYVGEDLAETPAHFEMFTRRLSNGFGYFVAMGLEQVLSYLESLQFTDEQIDYLQGTGIFKNAPAAFWELLRDGKFTGDVWAVPEGTPMFPHEPFLRIEAPLWQAQIVETFILNALNYQTLIATRAARMRHQAGDRTLLEFGTRRAFSPQGATWAARAALAGGLDATSNVLAAQQLGINPVGTMAHALVMAVGTLEGSEDEAFQAFHRYFPAAPLLIDTYDTMGAANRLKAQIASGETTLSGIRLDSGDLVQLSQDIHKLMPEINIFASGDLDEFEMERLQNAGAQIDGYGLGTKLVTGSPVNGVYKLVEIDNKSTMKKSKNKATYPGRKQVFRNVKAGGDHMALATESSQDNEIPLLKKVMQDGDRLTKPETLDQIRDRTKANVAKLPAGVKQVENPEPYPVKISEQLQTLTEEVAARLKKKH
ncbi:nicotinate phosphoribosyltransferase [[Leptolyngbya] sp. PCC 7376]|uniref:nicotinate phosphoribosyltransferase n=1 Tax=[Leptolyngbya] sp. PCC 7376 TaxID=111781 RepID=UPI00029EECBE|nr:nicotinate phosphoribosyltransferase [[Leptolyngbya] sp. PCC 7376]AFY40073.1 nicotinate phosphoribosyltransferase [[Leptolyngbya] sp. PCC 7376]